MSIFNDKLGTISGGRILDVATGDGSFIQLLANHLKDYTELIGIDTDQEVLELAGRNNKNERISFQVMSGDNLCFEDASFDTVSISNSLHHLTNLEYTLSEMYRVLKPDGVFIINELFCDEQNDKQLTHVKFHHLQAEVDTLLGIPHNKTFQKQEIVQIAENIRIGDLEVFVHENEIFNQYVRIDIFAERYKSVVNKIIEYPEYPRYHAELDQLITRLQEIGVAFASQLMIVGRKV